MSIQLLNDPLQLFIFKGFSDTFSYYPSLEILTKKEVYNEKWIQSLFHNFSYKIQFLEENNSDKNYFNFDLYDIFQKIVSHNIKIKNINFNNLIISNDKIECYSVIILNDNLSKNDIDFLIQIIFQQKFKTKNTIFIGYHKNIYIDWINEYNNKNFYYLANIDNNNIFDIEKWLYLIDIIKKSSFHISLGIHFFSIIQHLVSNNLNLKYVHDLDNKKYILEKSSNIVFSDYNYINNFKEFYKINFPFYIEFLNNLNENFLLEKKNNEKKELIEKLEKERKDRKINLYNPKHPLFHFTNSIINNNNKNPESYNNIKNIENIENIENIDIKTQNTQNNIFPFSEKNIIIKISNLYEYELLILTYIFILYENNEDFKTKKIFLYILNYTNTKHSNQFINEWKEKIKDYIFIEFYNNNTNINDSKKIINIDLLLSKIQINSNNNIKQHFFNYIKLPKNHIVFDKNYAIIYEKINNFNNENNHKKYLVLKHLNKNNVLEEFKKNNHVIDFDFIDIYRDSIPENDFEILYRDIYFIMNCNDFIGFELNKFNDRNSFLFFLLKKYNDDSSFSSKNFRLSAESFDSAKKDDNN